MAEQNPWKKQITVNRTKPEVVSGGSNDAPPWAKKNESPSWLKSANNQSQSPPPWKKKEEEATGSNIPPWVKNDKIASTTANPTSLNQSTTSSVPAWLKNQQNATNQAGWVKNNFNQESKIDWKMKQNDELKKKKQLQEQEAKQKEKIKKMEQQKNQSERERKQEEIRIQKQEEIKRQQKQRQQMKKEEQLAVLREKYQKQTQLQKQAVTAAKNRKKSVKKTHKRQNSALSSSKSKIKKSPRTKLATSSYEIQRDPCIFNAYLQLLKLELSASQYKEKLEVQQQIINLNLDFANKAEKLILNLFQNEKKKISDRKRKIIYDGDLQVQYAMCHGKKKQTKLQFSMEEINRLHSKFIYYDFLTSCVCSLLKKNPSLKLRVPLMVYVTYKGIDFLVEAKSQELSGTTQVQSTLYQQINNQIILLQRQIEHNSNDKFGQILNKDKLMVKKICLDEEEYYVVYVREDCIKHDSLSKKQKISEMMFTEYMLGQSQFPHLLRLFKTPKEMEQQEQFSSQSLVRLIHNINLANCIYKVYCSCQGEVEQQIFFKLILEGNSDIWDMINNAGCRERDISQAVVLAYLEKLGCLRFKYNRDLLYQPHKIKKIMRDEEIRPVTCIYTFRYELVELSSNLEKYIRQQKKQLTQQSISITRNIKQNLQKLQNSEFKFIELKRQLSYLMNSGEYEQCIEILDEQKLTWQFKDIGICLLYIKVYVCMNEEVALLKRLSLLLQLLEFYFENETILHSQVYSTMGSYYAMKRPSDIENHKKSLTFFEHSLNITLKLCGNKTADLAQIYYNRALSFIEMKQHTNAHKDILSAMKIYKTISKKNQKIAECIWLLGRIKIREGNETEGYESMEQALQMYLSMEHHVQALEVLFEMLKFTKKQPLLEKYSEKIMQVSLSYKNISSLKKILSICLERQLNCYNNLTIQQLRIISLDMDEEEEYKSEQEMVVELESNLNGYSNYTEVIRWCISTIASGRIYKKDIGGEYERARYIVSLMVFFIEE